jgi:hypothetical protein
MDSDVRETDKTPWDIKPGETAKSFKWFILYRDMGPERSLRDLGQTHSRGVAQLYDWSSRHHWPERAAQWDAYQQRRKQAQDEKNARQRAERNARQLEELDDMRLEWAKIAIGAAMNRTSKAITGPQVKIVKYKDTEGRDIEARSVDESVLAMRELADELIDKVRYPKVTEQAGHEIVLTEDRIAAMLAVERAERLCIEGAFSPVAGVDSESTQ